MMALNKSSNGMSNVVLIVILLLASQIVPSHCTPLMLNRRNLLHSPRSHATAKEMVEGTVTPTEGEGSAGATDDVRPSTPGHSPGIGHAFTNNKIGRKLLQSAASHSTAKEMVQGTITPTEGEGSAGATDDVRPSTPGHSPGIGHAFINNKNGRKLLTVAASPAKVMTGDGPSSRSYDKNEGDAEADAFISKNGRKILAVVLHSAASTATAAKGMIEGKITPSEGEGFAGSTDDVRPSSPGHSPGIGHAFTNNRNGRKLLTQ